MIPLGLMVVETSPLSGKSLIYKTINLTVCITLFLGSSLLDSDIVGAVILSLSNIMVHYISVT